MINKISSLANLVLPDDASKRYKVLKCTAITLMVVGILLLLAGSLSLCAIHGLIPQACFLYVLGSLGTKTAITLVVLGALTLSAGIALLKKNETNSTTLLSSDEVKQLRRKLNPGEYFRFTSENLEKGAAIKTLLGQKLTEVGYGTDILIKSASLTIQGVEQYKEVSLEDLQKR